MKLIFFIQKSKDIFKLLEISIWIKIYLIILIYTATGSEVKHL